MRKTLLYITALLLTGCTDIIEIDIKPADPQLVVDAWLTDELSPQKVQLTLSQPYFDNSAPQPALGAEVYVIKEDSTFYKFEDIKQDGNYQYEPKGESFLELNRPVGLYIKYQGEEFYSLSTMKRVPTIDSLKYQSIEFSGQAGQERTENIIAQFFATDFEGEGDTYLLKTTRNEEILTKPSQYTLIYDAGFNPGSGSDGMLFLQPIRMAINSGGLFADQDKLTIELFSITPDAYFFLYQMQMETSSGGIFDTPASNVPGNIRNLNPDSKVKAEGLFMVSKVSRFHAVIDKDEAYPFN